MSGCTVTGKLRRFTLVVYLTAAAAFPTAAQVQISLEPSAPSPSKVGSIVTWTGTVPGADPEAYLYRFRVRPLGFPFRVVKDFGPENTLPWTSTEHEGTFEIEVAARSRSTGQTTVARSRYIFESNVTGGSPALGATAHPLVLLYSAPPCSSGSRMKVRFQSAGGFLQQTPYKPCAAGLSMNFYLAGLLADTEYTAWHVIDTGDSFVEESAVSQFSGPIPELPESSVVKAAPTGDFWPILLQQNVFTNPIATNIAGAIVWYYPTTLSFATRPSGGGYFFGINQHPSGDPWRQIVREFDLTGMTVRETNAGRVNEQLAAMGKRPIDSFHHEAFRLPDDNIAVLAGVEQSLVDVQRPGAVNVLGDMVIVLNHDLDVVWTWDSFDYLDVRRRAIGDDRCAGGGGCPPLTAGANDWTHGNSIAPSPDGNLLVSFRSQDWVVKIAYDNGEGDGHIIWRLGKDGDFRLIPGDESLWFTHQHDARYEPLSGNRIMILDNGNTRRANDDKVTTRGQVWEIDEGSLAARVVLNADLERYSLALGSTQKLPNGNYQFVAGFLPDASGVSLEVDPTGRTVFALRTAAPVYRSYRLLDMYTPVR